MLCKNTILYDNICQLCSKMIRVFFFFFFVCGLLFDHPICRCMKNVWHVEVGAHGYTTDSRGKRKIYSTLYPNLKFMNLKLVLIVNITKR